MRMENPEHRFHVAIRSPFITANVYTDFTHSPVTKDLIITPAICGNIPRPPCERESAEHRQIKWINTNSCAQERLAGQMYSSTC